MSEVTTILWPGFSGETYRYWIYPIGTAFRQEPGNYIFAKQASAGRWTPVYIGETENLRDRLSNHEKMPCVTRCGGTHVHTHKTSRGEQARKSEEASLLARWDPPCNKE